MYEPLQLTQAYRSVHILGSLQTRTDGPLQQLCGRRITLGAGRCWKPKHAARCELNLPIGKNPRADTRRRTSKFLRLRHQRRKRTRRSDCLGERKCIRSGLKTRAMTSLKSLERIVCDPLSPFRVSAWRARKRAGIHPFIWIPVGFSHVGILPNNKRPYFERVLPKLHHLFLSLHHIHLSRNTKLHQSYHSSFTY